MKKILLPAGEQYKYAITGKFKALSAEWKHEKFPLFDYELIVMTEGILYVSYGEERFEVRQGEYLLLPPSDKYRGGYKEAYCSFYWMHFSTSDMGKALIEDSDESTKIEEDKDEKYLKFPQHGRLARPEKLVVLMKQLQDIVKNKYPEVSLNAAVTSIMCEVYGELTLNERLYQDRSEKNQIYLDIMDYIQKNLHRNIKISEIAEEFGYNGAYLSHLFSDIRGIPLKQYIMNQKADVANFMLTDNDKSITEIAAQLGFSDVHSFARSYKKITGLTPSEYRNAYAKRMLFHK